MSCAFQPTGERDKNGRLISKCVNAIPGTGEKCGIVAYGDRPANCKHCRANGAFPRPTEFAEIPCTKRGPIELVEIPACCNGTALVEFANCERGRCSVRGVDKSVACFGCSERTA